MARPFVVRVGDLLRDPGSGRDVDIVAEVDPLSTSSASTIPGMPLFVDGTVLAMANGVEIIGAITYDWYGGCRRCLEDVTGRKIVDLREVAQRNPVDDEVLPIEGDLLDLEPLVRELVLSSLPLAPLCSETCTGPDPDRFPTVSEADQSRERPADPRWAGLADLEFD